MRVSFEEHRLPEPTILGVDIENAPRWGFSKGWVWDQMTCVSFKPVTSAEDVRFDPARLVLDPELLIPMECAAVAPVSVTYIDWRWPDSVLESILEPLWAALSEATHLLGHNFTHDWEHLSSTRAELLLSRLEKKPIIDTKDAIPFGPFRDLDSLAYRFGLGVKPHLSSQAWADAHQRGDAKAKRLVAYRNAIDVVITERLYWTEKELGWL